METTIQKHYDKVLNDYCTNADSVIKDFLFVNRRRGGLEENK